MTVPAKLAGFAAVLALAFGAAFALGSLADPVTSEAAEEGGAHTEDPAMAGGDTDGSHVDDGGHEQDGLGAEPASAALPGLAVSQDGYTLVPRTTSVPAGRSVPYVFTVTGPDGAPVTAYTESHEKELHLIVVRRDLVGFQHVHPTRSPDGTWTVDLDLSEPGAYRVFADFEPAALGDGLTLGADLFVGGDFSPAPLPPAAATDRVGGFDVALDGAAVAGEETELVFTLSEEGTPVTDLQPYLGAFGHLVALRGGDLAYLHTHPAQDAHPGDVGGPQVRFATTFPTAGTYRLFLDFAVDGTVRTAEFTVTVGEEGGRP